MMYVVDTNIVSELMKKQPAANVINWLSAHDSKLFLTVVTIEELRFGELMMPKGKRRAQLHDSINTLIESYSSKTLPFDALAAEVCAEFHKKAISAGRTPTIEDLIIASITKIRGFTLVTRNTKDFDYLDLETFDPFTAG